MCVAVSVKCGDKYEYCHSVRELADQLGIDPAKVSDDPPDNCLCNANLAALGIVKNQDPDEWWPEFFIELPPHTQGAK